MPVADYKCKECGQEVEHIASPLPASITQEHDGCDHDTLDRVWSKFGVGRGTSGGTPPR